MKKIDRLEVLYELCKATKKWGMYVQINTAYAFGKDATVYTKGVIDETLKAAPYLNTEQDSGILFDERGYILFDSEKECWNAYESTVGDEGPTKLNMYEGPGNVYAEVVNDKGESIMCNT